MVGVVNKVKVARMVRIARMVRVARAVSFQGEQAIRHSEQLLFYGEAWIIQLKRIVGNLK